MQQRRGVTMKTPQRHWLQAAGLGAYFSAIFRCKWAKMTSIALDGEQLVFVEVRSRSNPRFAQRQPQWRAKQQKLLARSKRPSATQCLLEGNPCRFDVLGFDPRQSATDSAPQWIRAAFCGPDFLWRILHMDDNYGLLPIPFKKRSAPCDGRRRLGDRYSEQLPACRHTAAAEGKIIGLRNGVECEPEPTVSARALLQALSKNRPALAGACAGSMTATPHGYRQ